MHLDPSVSLPTHPIDPEPRRIGWEYAAPIRIADNVWLGGGVTVCPASGSGPTVVGAGAVVSQDLPEGVVAAGVRLASCARSATGTALRCRRSDQFGSGTDFRSRLSERRARNKGRPQCALGVEKRHNRRGQLAQLVVLCARRKGQFSTKGGVRPPEAGQFLGCGFPL
jgi:hypothetical protein